MQRCHKVISARLVETNIKSTDVSSEVIWKNLLQIP